MHPAREFHLFCLALRRPFQPQDLARLRQGIAAGPDWPLILEAARRHRVAPLLLAGIRASGAPELPPGVLDELRRQALDTAARNLAQAREVARLSLIFDRAGIPMLALKGVVLSAQLGEDAGLRNSRDIDLLVAPEHYAAAQAMLQDAGYRIEAPALSARQDAAYRRWVKDAAYSNESTGTKVELHHRLSDNPALLAVDFAQLWHRRDVVRLAGAAVAGLPRHYLPLYLCAHGAGHCWEELRWLVDFAAALGVPGAVDAAVRAATAAGLEAAMLHALLLAHDWLGLPLAACHLARARASRRVRRLDRILGHFYGPADWHRTPRRGSRAGLVRYSLWLRAYTYSLKADWRYRRWQAMREFVTPADWQVLPLPDRLFWLFPLLRPFGWLLRRRHR